MSLTEAKRDILPALTQLSLGRLLLSRAYLRFTGRFEFNRSIGPVKSKHEQDNKIFFLSCPACENLHSECFTDRFYYRAANKGPKTFGHYQVGSPLRFASYESFRHGIPIDHIEKRSDVIRSSVLIM